MAEAEAADGERKELGEKLAAAKKAVAELQKQVGGWVGGQGERCRQAWLREAGPAGPCPQASVGRHQLAGGARMSSSTAHHNHRPPPPPPPRAQVAELAKVVAAAKADYDTRAARLAELQVGCCCCCCRQLLN